MWKPFRRDVTAGHRSWARSSRHRDRARRTLMVSDAGRACHRSARAVAPRRRLVRAHHHQATRRRTLIDPLQSRRGAVLPRRGPQVKPTSLNLYPALSQPRPHFCGGNFSVGPAPAFIRNVLTKADEIAVDKLWRTADTRALHPLVIVSIYFLSEGRWWQIAC